MRLVEQTREAKMATFDCDFDAPMYVDFTNIDDDQNPDSFFGKLVKF